MRTLQKRYARGRLPFTACQADPRFAYCLYVPERLLDGPKQGAQPVPLLVVVHGSARTAESFRDQFIELAERQGCVILAPLFPQRATGAADLDGYKLQPPLHYRFDQCLLAMVEEVAAQFPLDARFYLFGFSGGAQFAHRFYYLHPECLHAVAIAAPGSVSLPIARDPIWQQAGAGRPDHLARLRGVALHLSIGSEDGVEAGLNADMRPASSQPASLQPGPSHRRQHLQALHQQLERLQIPAQLEVVAGAGHDGFALLPASQQFLESAMTQDAHRRMRVGRRKGKICAH